jgi:hypothetical protein
MTGGLKTADGVNLLENPLPRSVYLPNNYGGVETRVVATDGNYVYVHHMWHYSLRGDSNYNRHAAEWAARFYADRTLAEGRANELRIAAFPTHDELVAQLQSQGLRVVTGEIWVTQGDEPSWDGEIAIGADGTGHEVRECHRPKPWNLCALPTHEQDSLAGLWQRMTPWTCDKITLYYDPADRIWTDVKHEPDWCGGVKGQRHDWEMISHEERHCRHCNAYDFVPDL